MTPTRIEDRASTATSVAGMLLWLLILSALLFETDAYRFAAIAVSFYGLVFAMRLQPRPAISPLALLCVGWSLYVLVRFAYAYAASSGAVRGASEWLYAFPVFFPTLGVALTRLRPHFGIVLAVFFTLSAVLLAATQHWWITASGKPVTPLFHKNQIHGAVACGLILIGAFYWFLHHAGQGFRNSLEGRIAALVGPVVIFLCLASIVGSHSKGVWLALAGTLPVAGVWVILGQRRRVAWAAMAALLLVVLAGAVLLRDRLWAVAGRTFDATLSLFGRLGQGGDLAAALRQNIESGANPNAMNERLELWYNALEIIRKAPLFGHGNFWLEEWHRTRYADVGYTLMHNGYLEILVRHGLFGLIVLAVMLAGLLVLVARAGSRGLISPLARQAYFILVLFFLLTLLSNSNNRLAIGESFAMMAGGFAFYCQLAEFYRRRGEWPDAGGAAHGGA